MAGWLVPAAMLAFLPKCPVCLALYLVAATGIGVSVATAGRLRMAIVCLCTLWLLYAAGRGFDRIGLLVKRTQLFRSSR